MQRTIDVVVTWAGTALSVERLARGERFTIGALPPHVDGAHHFLFDHPSLPAPAFPLVEHRADGTVVVRDVDDVEGAALAKGQRVRIGVGPLVVDVAAAERAPTVVDAARDLVDGRLVRVSGIALALHAGFVMMLLFTRAPAPEEIAIGSATPPRWVASSTPSRPVARVEQRAADAPAPAAAPAARRRRALDRANKAGPDARALAQQAIAAMLGGGDARSRVFGERGFASDMSGMRGTPSFADASGAGVRRGPGGAGGRFAEASGIDGRIGDGPAGHEGDVSLTTRKRKPVVIVDPAPPVHSDGLTREEIQRVLSRVMAQIKFCYEKELNREPALEGKLVTSWTIAKDGGVVGARAASSTLGAGAGDQVGACVVRILSRLSFPAPRGGTQQVVVTYPFVFSSSGDR